MMAALVGLYTSFHNCLSSDFGNNVTQLQSLLHAIHVFLLPNAKNTDPATLKCSQGLL